MEPVTHILTGTVLARAGFNRKAAYATAAMAIAAEMPDLDTIASWWGPVAGFEHHRGITHTFLAIPVEAAVVTAGFYAWQRWRRRAGGEKTRRAQVSWGWLYTGALLALLSHLLLDWTNNYGLRPFFPFDPRWYAGSFVFIFEPVLFALLLGALVMPWLFGLVNSEVGARKTAFPGRSWAIAALIGIAALYGFRYGEHEKAVRIVTQDGEGQTSRVFASPRPFTPYSWAAVSDLPGAYKLSTVDTLRGVVEPPAPEDMIYKPQTTVELLAAKRTYLGRIYLDWSSYPVLSEEMKTDAAGKSLATITFADARFMYDVSFLKGRAKPPISGTVTLDMAAPEGQRVVETKMGERAQR